MANYFDYTEIALADEEYNLKMDGQWPNHRALNNFVMSHTLAKCKLDDFLQKSILKTKERQFVVYENDSLNIKRDGGTKNIIVSNKRSFEAAKQYRNKKVAVLSFANNHSIGGAPFSAGAQEESLCRISTLYECLKKEEKSFYEKHKISKEFASFAMWGNDDLIYSPGVVVFKTDESAPKVLPSSEWYKVDVITCAAPELPEDYFVEDFDWGMSCGLKRLRKVFEVAKKQGIEVLILGAWGCGAFNNPPTAVAATFKILCDEYKFDIIEFAVDDSRGSNNYNVFRKILN